MKICFRSLFFLQSDIYAIFKKSFFLSQLSDWVSKARFSDPPGHIIEKIIDVCGYLFGTSIIIWKVIAAHQLIYHDISNPSAHHEIRSPRAKKKKKKKS